KEKSMDQEDGEVTIFFDPAKNLIPVRSREALPHIVAALAMSDSPAFPREAAQMIRVYNAAALNGDGDLALLLVVRHASVPQGPDQEKLQAPILAAIQQ